METAFFIQSLPFFKGLSDNDIAALVDAAHIKTYPKRSHIHMQGDPGDRFFVMMSGWIKLTQTTMEGNEAVLALFTRGDSFGEAILFEGASYPNNAEVVEEVKVIELPAQTLREIAKKSPDLSLRLMETMTHHIQRLQLENEHLSIMSTTQRTGCFLLQLCLGMEQCTGHLNFPYDKHLAAARLGMKPETFSRALKDLQKLGVSVKGNDIFIESRQNLEDFCCSNCSCSPENCMLCKSGGCSAFQAA